MGKKCVQTGGKYVGYMWVIYRLFHHFKQSQVHARVFVLNLSTEWVLFKRLIHIRLLSFTRLFSQKYTLYTGTTTITNLINR